MLALTRALKVFASTVREILNVEKNTLQAEVTKFNSVMITSNHSGAEFVGTVEAQAKNLENLGREVTEEDKLTRLKEGLTDRRYSQLAHSLPKPWSVPAQSDGATPPLAAALNLYPYSLTSTFSARHAFRSLLFSWPSWNLRAQRA